MMYAQHFSFPKNECAEIQQAAVDSLCSQSLLTPCVHSSLNGRVGDGETL